MVLTNDAKERIATLLQDSESDGSKGYSDQALGTDSTTEASTDDALGSEEFRKTCTNKSVAQNVVQFDTTVLTTEGNGQTYKEAGLFSMSSGGNMLMRQTFAGIAKTSAIELRISVKVTVQEGV